MKSRLFSLLGAVLASSLASCVACSAAPTAQKSPNRIVPGPVSTPAVAVAPEYDTTHVYVAPELVDRFAQSFLATFGGATSTPRSAPFQKTAYTYPPTASRHFWRIF